MHGLFCKYSSAAFLSENRAMVHTQSESPFTSSRPPMDMVPKESKSNSNLDDPVQIPCAKMQIGMY